MSSLLSLTSEHGAERAVALITAPWVDPAPRRSAAGVGNQEQCLREAFRVLGLNTTPWSGIELAPTYMSPQALRNLNRLPEAEVLNGDIRDLVSMRADEVAAYGFL